MGFCSRTANIWQILGYCLLILKIIIPLIIIILGTVDLGKAVVSSDQKVIKDAGGNLLKRIILGVCIFFIPNIIDVIFNFVADFSEDIRNDYENCFDCLVYPGTSCDTSGVNSNNDFFPIN